MDAASSAKPITILRWRVALALAALAGLPFLFVAIPPLTDVPGHIGGFAVQTAPAGDIIRHWFGFHWAPTLNLASDLLVEAMAPAIGIFRATWLVAIATPMLTVLGIATLARAYNPRGASALPWALPFVYSWPFLWGFLNFFFTAALALFYIAGWSLIADRPRWRAAIYLAATPLLLIGHGVAGVVAIAGVTASAAARDRRSPRALGRLWPVLIAAAATILAWKALDSSDQGATVWLPLRKLEAAAMMLRDQNRWFDVASVVAAAGVAITGWRWGAHLRGEGRWIVLVVLALFLATPSLLSGSDRLDTRLAPLIPMLFFALQDWSGVAPARRRLVTIAGFTLAGVRLAVIVASFIGYDARYRAELAALDHVRPGSRVLNLSHVDCIRTGWRSERTEHLANLATPIRHAWVNAHWSIAGLQLLQVRYSPSPRYDRDPSHLIWPAACIDPRIGYADRPNHTLIETMPHLPLDRVDYLWLVGLRLPHDYRDPRLVPQWRSATSELYAVRRTP